MNQFSLSTKLFSLFLGLSAVVFFFAGCGASSGVSVQTGSLTQAEFTQRADAACAAVRVNFLREYATYLKKHTPEQDGEEAFAEAVIEKVLAPNYGDRLIDQLSAIGVSSGEEEKLVSFLEALKQRVGELQDEPGELLASPFPFLKVARLARRDGLNGCADSFG